LFSAARDGSADWQSAVSQDATCRVSIIGAPVRLPTSCRLAIGDTADYQSALRKTDTRGVIQQLSFVLQADRSVTPLQLLQDLLLVDGIMVLSISPR
jgi:hypothetical protein